MRNPPGDPLQRHFLQLHQWARCKSLRQRLFNVELNPIQWDISHTMQNWISFYENYLIQCRSYYWGFKTISEFKYSLIRCRIYSILSRQGNQQINSSTNSNRSAIPQPQQDETYPSPSPVLVLGASFSVKCPAVLMVWKLKPMRHRCPHHTESPEETQHNMRHQHHHPTDPSTHTRQQCR